FTLEQAIVMQSPDRLREVQELRLVGFDSGGLAQSKEEMFLHPAAMIHRFAVGDWRNATPESLDILSRCFDVPPAPAAVERVGIGAEAAVGLQAPVLQIVRRLETRTSKVRDLVAADSLTRQPLDRFEIEVGD